MVNNSHLPNHFNSMLTLGASFVDAPLTIKNSGNSSVVGIKEIVSQMWVGHITGMYSPKEWLQIGARASYNFADINNAILGAGENIDGISDIELRLNTRFINRDKWAMSIIPYVSFPLKGGEFSPAAGSTGTSIDGTTQHLFSDEGVGYGAILTSEHVFKHFQLALNLGFGFNQDAKTVGLNGSIEEDFTQRLLSSVGVYIPFTDQTGANVEYSRIWSRPLINDDINPNELTLSLNTALSKNFRGYASAGLGNVLQSDDGNDYRFSLGIKLASLRNKALPIKKAVLPEPIVKPIPVIEEKCEGQFIFDKSNQAIVRFPNNIAKLGLEKIQGINEVLSTIKSRVQDIQSVLIIGHTSSTGSARYNLALSEKRAKAVANIFIQNGIPSELIQSLGKGESELIVENDTSEALQSQNRRAEFRVTLKKQDYSHCK